MEYQACPICRQNYGLKAKEDPGNETVHFECERCGKFTMTEELIEDLPGWGEKGRELLPCLSAYTRQSSDRGMAPFLDSDNWIAFARAHASTPAQTKASRLLDVVARKSQYPGHLVPINPDLDAPLFDARGGEEARFLIEHLIARNLLKFRQEAYVLTVEGWQQVESRGGRATGQPRRCFVAMSFDPTLAEAYTTGIEGALNDCGIQSIRVDKEQYNDQICDRMLAEIRRAAFVVADVTLHRQNVYFEAGFAMGLGIPVIYSCQADHFGDRHFDTGQYNHIVWTTPEDLRAKLSDRIRATTPE